MIAPLDVIRVLNGAKVQFMLVGAHGLAGWTKKPRATEDVDILVATRHHKKALKVLLDAFPQLEPRDLPVVTRLCDRQSGDVVIDVMKPLQEPHWSAFKYAHTVKGEEQAYKIPSLELAVVMKFAAMISLYRGETEKLQDAHDFRQMIEANPDLDLDRLAELGNLIYPVGGQDLLEMVRRVRAGEKLLL
jgi:hypothetical protein